MARKKKPPWNADLPLPPWAGGPEHVVPPAPDTLSPSHSTGTHYENPPDSGATSWQCGRRLWLAERVGEEIPDHALRCPYRGTGRDPDPKG